MKLAFFTRNRPGHCVAAVDSFAAASRDWATTPAIDVFDDTDAEADRQSLRVELARIALERGVQVGYAGREEKQQYVDRLTSKLDRSVKDVVRFGLDSQARGITTGANCNALALQFSGQRALFLADDQRAVFARPRDDVAPTAISASADPTTIWRFADRDSACAARPAEPIDLVAEHAAVLGKTVTELGVGTTDARVRLTSSGMWGDCGMSAPTYLWMCRLGNAEYVAEHYEDVRWSREVVRATPGLTVSSSTSPMFMTSGAAVDFSAATPPFIPFGRSQDGLFALCLRHCDPMSRVAYLPVAVSHTPEPRLFSAAERSRLAAPPRVVDVLTIAVSTVASLLEGVESFEGRIELLGDELQRLGRQGESGLRGLCREIRRNRQLLAEVIARLTERMPAAFVSDAAAATEAIRNGCAQDWTIVSDPPPGGVMKLVERFGELLSAWPAITDAAAGIDRPALALG